MEFQRRSSPWDTGNSTEGIGKRIKASLLPVTVIATLTIGFVLLSGHHKDQILRPKLAIANLRDHSLSFTEEQFRSQCRVHDAVYDAFSGGEPVWYSGLSFGNGVNLVGQKVCSSAKDAWPILDRPSAVSENSTCFGPALDQVDRIAREHPEMTVGVIIESDGEYTDGDSCSSAVKRLATRPNIAFVVVTGIIESSRLRLAQCMAPLKERFIPIDPNDLNEALKAKIAALGSSKRGSR